MCPGEGALSKALPGSVANGTDVPYPAHGITGYARCRRGVRNGLHDQKQDARCEWLASLVAPARNVTLGHSDYTAASAGARLVGSVRGGRPVMAIQKPEWFKLDAAKFLSDAQVDAMKSRSRWTSGIAVATGARQKANPAMQPSVLTDAWWSGFTA